MEALFITPEYAGELISKSGEVNEKGQTILYTKEPLYYTEEYQRSLVYHIVNAVEAVHSYLPHKTIIIPAEDIIEAQNSVICRHKYVPQLLQVLPKLLKAQVLNQCE